MKFYGLKNCDTCRKAMKELDAAGVAYEYVDVRADGVEETTLKGWVEASGADKLVNRRSTTWRGLTDEEKASIEDPASLVALLTDNPTLIKRPVIVTKNDIHIGWTAEVKSVLGA